MVLGKMEGGKKKKAIEVPLPLLLLLLVFAHVELAEGVSIFFFQLRDTIFLCGQIGNFLDFSLIKTNVFSAFCRC
jgi:hypothetical protein